MWIRFVLVVAALSGPVVGAGAVSAGTPGVEPGAPITVSPTEGGPYTVVTVSGEDCTEGPSPSVAGGLESEPNVGPIAQFSVTPDDTGAWTATLTVPPNLPEAAYRVTATCKTGPGQFDGVDYGAEPFTVLAGERATLTVSPVTGPADAALTLTVSGTQCRTDGASELLVGVSLADTEEADEYVDRRAYVPDEDGNWTAQLTIPAAPAARYHVSTTCWIDPLTAFLYDAVEVVTVAAEQPDRPPAPPARPLPGRPTFTG